jgi:hypothetical protein
LAIRVAFPQSSGAPMRPPSFFGLASMFVLLGACFMQQNQTGGGTGNGADGGTSAEGGAGDSGAIQGAGCGSERQTGIQLCAATSMCPNLVVDTQSMPSCGFRIRGTAVDLVCGCGEQVCPMGIFSNCAQAAQLLANQTESQVCAQIGEGRCTDAASASSTSSSSSSSSSSSGGSSPCDKQCLAECGGGAGCASVCNCQ